MDGGSRIFGASERDTLLAEEPMGAEQVLRPFIGGDEIINGAARWLLLFHKASVRVIRASLNFRMRVAAVRKFLEESGGPLPLSLAAILPAATSQLFTQHCSLSVPM